MKKHVSLLLAVCLLSSVILSAGCTDSGSKKKLKAAIGSIMINEGNSGTTVFIFTVGLSKAAKADVSIDYATSPETAEDETGSGDFTSASGTLVIPAGSNIGYIYISINADTDIEEDETFSVTLSNPVNVILKNTEATGTVLNDDSAGMVPVEGTITYDFVPATLADGLGYTAVSSKPVRGAVVEALLASDDSYIDSTDTDPTGNYSLIVPKDTDVYIRVYARMFRTGIPSWDFQVVDNTSSQALYVLDSADFNSGSAAITGKDLHASCGWDAVSSEYTSERTAAPFAVLDTVYSAASKVLSADAFAVFPPLLINWSINNVSSLTYDPPSGQIYTSHYSLTDGELFILGDADSDTDEFDNHVIAHEWGHYFEDNFSRADSIGGPHGAYDRLDPRLSFGEGWGNAFSGMATDDRYYVDTYGDDQGYGWYMDLENNMEEESAEGFWSEISVQVILYDLYDSASDSNDTVSLGFAPLFDVLTGPQKTTDAFTTIYSFITALRDDYSAQPAIQTGIDNLVTAEKIYGTGIWGTGETNGDSDPDVLPVYAELVDGAAAVTVGCDDTYDYYNKLLNRHFFYFEITASGTYTITAVPDSDGNPVIELFSKGESIGYRNAGGSGTTEILTVTLEPGFYCGEVYEYDAYSGTPTPREYFQLSLN